MRVNSEVQKNFRHVHALRHKMTSRHYSAQNWWYNPILTKLGKEEKTLLLLYE